MVNRCIKHTRSGKCHFLRKGHLTSKLLFSWLQYVLQPTFRSWLIHILNILGHEDAIFEESLTHLCWSLHDSSRKCNCFKNKLRTDTKATNCTLLTYSWLYKSYIITVILYYKGLHHLRCILCPIRYSRLWLMGLPAKLVVWQHVPAVKVDCTRWDGRCFAFHMNNAKSIVILP